MFQVNKSSSDFWNSLKLTWQQCADLSYKQWATSVAEMNGKVYITTMDNKFNYTSPFMYDCNKDQWYLLPALPSARFSLVTVPDRKQLLAIGGIMYINNEADVITNKVFLWDGENRRWTTPYPNMPTARCFCSSISHGSTVIVAGGVTFSDPFTVTRAVEVLHIKEHSLFSKSYWSIVEQTPHVVWEPILLIVDDKLYVTQGYDENKTTSCNIVTTSVPELLQSSNRNTSCSQVWHKLPDMPYSSFSINHYQGHLITFGGGHHVEKQDKGKPIWQSVPLIHIYNPDTKTWDCVGEIPYGYLLGKSIHIKENKILFIGGFTGTHDYEPNDDDRITTCSIVTL